MVTKDQLYALDALHSVRNRLDLHALGQGPTAGEIPMKLTAFRRSIGALVATGWLAAFAGAPALAQLPAFEALYTETCSACHGAALEGSPTGAALDGPALRHGDSIDEIAESIARGFPEAGMQPFADSFDAAQIRGLAIMTIEQRSQLSYSDFKVTVSPDIGN